MLVVLGDFAPCVREAWLNSSAGGSRDCDGVVYTMVDQEAE